MCTDVNLMPVAVYQLIFKDPSQQKLTPPSLEIETYMIDVVKIIGSCQFYLVHPEMRKLIPVIFFMAKENGSVLLSCRTTMALGLIKPHARLNYLPPRVSLLTSTCDHPNTTETTKAKHTSYERMTNSENLILQNVNARSTQSKDNMIPEDN